jgi:predicted metal-dependent hydrolase
METIDFPKIGEVHFVRSKRSERIRITIRPFKGIRVSFPFGVSLNAAQNFLFSKEDWILKQQTKIRSYEEKITEAQKNDNQVDYQAACEHLHQRLVYLAEKHNLDFNRITFRRQKTRWGSCSAKNNLNLNVKLIKLPQELQDYVILHELVHTKIKNHSLHFWQELGKVLPGAKVLNKELRKYQILAL